MYLLNKPIVENSEVFGIVKLSKSQAEEQPVYMRFFPTLLASVSTTVYISSAVNVVTALQTKWNIWRAF